jgi:hypothetical protein
VSTLLGNKDLINSLIHESDLPDFNNFCHRLQSETVVGQCDPSEMGFAALPFIEIDQNELRSPDIAGFDS